MAKTALPHFTTNTALAVAAFLLRIPVTRRRIYTEDFLERNRTTAKQAHQRGMLGEVHYAIHTEQNPNWPGVVAAFNEEKLAIEEGQETVPLDLDPKQVARLACRVLMARKNFMRDLLRMVPFIRIRKPGAPKKSPPRADGSFTMEVPGFIDCRIDADENTREHLGLS